MIRRQNSSLDSPEFRRIMPSLPEFLRIQLQTRSCAPSFFAESASSIKWE
jgi:hypothetical protein